MKLPPLKWVEAGGAIALGLLVSFTVGRATAPGHSITTDKVADIKADTSTTAAAAETKKADDSKVVTRWQTRIVHEPGGTTTVVRTVIKEVERKATESTAVATVSADTHEAARIETHERIVERLVRPSWAIGAHAGLGLDGLPRYGGDVGRRLFGGLWLTAGVDATGRAGTLGLRLEF